MSKKKITKEIIIVTGTAGFIGFHVAQRLLSEGYEVIGLDNFNDYYNPIIKEARSEILRKNSGFHEFRIDLTEYEAVKKIISGLNATKICHLAAQAGVRYSIKNPFAYERSNLASFINILEICRHCKINRLVYASSSSVYGGLKKLPFSETDNVDTPISLYAATKKANELMAHCYTHLYGIQTIGLRFFTVYGPWGRPDMAMWIFAEAITNGKPIDVYNYGRMKRDFTYIDDIVNGVCSALFSQKLSKYEIFNLGNHRAESLLHMIELIEKELGIKAKKKLLPMQAGDIPQSFADISRAQKKLNFHPHTPIDIGVPKFIEWYKAHPEITSEVAKTRNKN